MYKYVDGTDPSTPKELSGVTDKENPTTVNAADVLIAVAPQIPGYTPSELRKSIPVNTDTDAVEVTFTYIKKQTGSVTVLHKAGNVTISSYTASGSVGEWFTANVLALDAQNLTTDGKYKFVGAEKTQTVQITAAAQEIVFEYEANYVQVNAYISADGTETEYQTGIKVVKRTGTQTLYALSRIGYVLKGITVTQTGAETDGSATSFPAYWNNNALTLSNLTADTKVVYH